MAKARNKPVENPIEIKVEEVPIVEAKPKEPEKEEINEKLEKISVDQILNELRITGRNRIIIKKKYSIDVKTKSDWEKLLKNKGFAF